MFKTRPAHIGSLSPGMSYLQDAVFRPDDGIGKIKMAYDLLYENYSMNSKVNKKLI